MVRLLTILEAALFLFSKAPLCYGDVVEVTKLRAKILNYSFNVGLNMKLACFSRINARILGVGEDFKWGKLAIAPSLINSVVTDFRYG